MFKQLLTSKKDKKIEQYKEDHKQEIDIISNTACIQTISRGLHDIYKHLDSFKTLILILDQVASLMKSGASQDVKIDILDHTFILSIRDHKIINLTLK